MAQKTINYDVVSEFAGHQQNTGVELVEAAKDIFTKVKNKAMQCSIKGEFIEFADVDELQGKLQEAAIGGFTIRVYDEIYGG